MKIIIGLLMAAIAYIRFSPVWDLSLVTIGICLFLFCFFYLIVGFPISLYIHTRRFEKSFFNAFWTNFICIGLSLLTPLIVGRWFQIHMAKIKNLSQWGEGALFKSGELTEQGLIWIRHDFTAMVLGALLASILVAVSSKVSLKKFHDSN